MCSIFGVTIRIEIIILFMVFLSIMFINLVGNNTTYTFYKQQEAFGSRIFTDSISDGVKTSWVKKSDDYKLTDYETDFYGTNDVKCLARGDDSSSSSDLLLDDTKFGANCCNTVYDPINLSGSSGCACNNSKLKNFYNTRGGNMLVDEAVHTPCNLK
jgi:hypothetical protein